MASATAATAAPATAEAVEETAAVACAALSLISCTEGALGTSGMPARNCSLLHERRDAAIKSCYLLKLLCTPGGGAHRILQRRRASFQTVHYWVVVKVSSE